MLSRGGKGSNSGAHSLPLATQGMGQTVGVWQEQGDSETLLPQSKGTGADRTTDGREEVGEFGTVPKRDGTTKLGHFSAVTKRRIYSDFILPAQFIMLSLLARPAPPTIYRAVKALGQWVSNSSKQEAHQGLFSPLEPRLELTQL